MKLSGGRNQIPGSRLKSAWSRGNAVAFWIEVDMEEHGFHVITVASQNLSIRRNDGQLLSLETFLQLGADYRTAFSNRRPNT